MPFELNKLEEILVRGGPFVAEEAAKVQLEHPEFVERVKHIVFRHGAFALDRYAPESWHYLISSEIISPDWMCGHYFILMGDFVALTGDVLDESVHPKSNRSVYEDLVLYILREIVNMIELSDFQRPFRRFIEKVISVADSGFSNILQWMLDQPEYLKYFVDDSQFGKS